MFQEREFGEVLKEIRIDRDISQEELAQILNTSKQVISRYERGQRTPKISTVSEYAHLLNVSMEYLMGVESKDAVLMAELLKNKQFKEVEKLMGLPKGSILQPTPVDIESENHSQILGKFEDLSKTLNCILELQESIQCILSAFSNSLNDSLSFELSLKNIQEDNLKLLDLEITRLYGEQATYRMQLEGSLDEYEKSIRCAKFYYSGLIRTIKNNYNTEFLTLRGEFHAKEESDSQRPGSGDDTPAE